MVVLIVPSEGEADFFSVVVAALDGTREYDRHEAGTRRRVHLAAVKRAGLSAVECCVVRSAIDLLLDFPCVEVIWGRGGHGHN